MTQPKRYYFRLNHTQILLIGLLIGYFGFVFWLGIRLTVLLSGAVIVLLAIASWYMQLKSQKNSPSVTSTNLLQTEVFISHLNHLNHQIPDNSLSLWIAVQQQAQTIQQITKQIAQQESTFTPDLLETLHTVLDLVAQLVEALQVTQKVQTPRYQELAQRKLQRSQKRLQQTHDQLQELHDQIALETLERRSIYAPNLISKQLQMLIVDNEKGLLEN
ncbi:MAG: hypothetical protein AB3A66_05030 [Nodularia sp. CChRGM 3473]